MRVILLGPKNLQWFTNEAIADDDLVIINGTTIAPPDIRCKSIEMITVSEVYSDVSRTLEFDRDECVKALGPIFEQDPNARIFCNQEANVELAERLRRSFALKSHFSGDPNRYRDKLLMKQMVADSGLRVPKFTELGRARATTYQQVVEAVGAPAIIKPRASVGSRGVYKIRSEGDFERFNIETQGDPTEYEAEEFIEGDLYQCDFAVQAGEVLFRAVSRYSVPMADLQEGKPLASVMVEPHDPVHGRISDFATSCLASVGMDDGCFHMEVFHSVNDEIIFLEVAARSPGLFSVPIYRNWVGVNMYDLEYLIQTGREAGASARQSPNHKSSPSFFVIFPHREGRVGKTNVPKIDADYDMVWNVKPGQSYGRTTTNVEHAGSAVVRCQNPAKLQIALRYMTDQFEPVSFL